MTIGCLLLFALLCSLITISMLGIALRNAQNKISVLEGRSPVIDALYELKPESHSVIFADAGVIDFEALAETDWPKDMPGGLLIPVHCRRGQSVKDAFLKIPREELTALLEEIDVNAKGAA